MQSTVAPVGMLARAVNVVKKGPVSMTAQPLNACVTASVSPLIRLLCIVVLAGILARKAKVATRGFVVSNVLLGKHSVTIVALN